MRPVQLVSKGVITHIHLTISGNAEDETILSTKEELLKRLRKALRRIFENADEILQEVDRFQDFTIGTRSSYAHTACAADEDVLVDDVPFDGPFDEHAGHSYDNNIAWKSDKREKHREKGKRNQNKRRRPSTSSSKFVSIQLWAKTSTDCILSSNCLSKHTDLNIDEVVDEFVSLISGRAAIDEHTADQLILYMFLANGTSQLLVSPPSRSSSLHIESMFHVIETIIGRKVFTMEQQFDGCRLITCEGISYWPR